MNWLELCAALCNDACINLTGNVIIPPGQYLNISQNNVRITGNGTIHAQTSGYAIQHVGQRLVMDGITLWNQRGAGILSTNGARSLYVDKMQVNTLGNGLHLANGGGAWIVNTHFNGLGSGSYGILAGQWDTINSVGCITEAHDVCFRAGIGGESANMEFATLQGDRCKIGMIFEPGGGGKINSLQMGTVWLAGQGGGSSPLNAHAYEGPLNDVVIGQLRATDFVQKYVSTNGADVRILDQRHR